MLPLGPSPLGSQAAGTKACAKVVSVDDSDVGDQGLLRMGTQHLTVRVVSGAHRGRIFRADNELRAQMDLDKTFRPGDLALVSIIDGADPEKTTINAQDHFRLHWSLVLFAIFGALLLWFGRGTGLKALVSFVFACCVVLRVVIPLCLRGWNPVWTATGAVGLLTAVIVFLVAGRGRKGQAAFAGSMLGVLTGAILAEVFSELFEVNGAVMPFSEPLLYCGYEFLDLRDLFTAAVILASSGAVMDLGMDVAAGMDEVIRHNPDLSRRELMLSGFRIGQSVVGTMTTTLLLAYAGGYLTLLMSFTAQGVSWVDFLNHPHVAAETVKTLIGSFALVTVAPFTALAGSLIYARGAK